MEVLNSNWSDVMNWSHWQLTNDVSMLTYPGPRYKEVTGHVVINIVCCVLIIMTSLVGNCWVVWVVSRTRRLRTTTNFYLVNLAAADLAVTLLCTWVYLVTMVTHNWPLGAIFCKLNSFAQAVALLASVFTLLIISCDRFFGIMFAMKARITERRPAMFIVAVWLVAIAIASPILAHRRQYTRVWADYVEVWCADDWLVENKASDVTSGEAKVTVSEGKVVYFTVLCGALFFLPVAVMVTVHTAIIIKLWDSKLPGEVTAANRLTHRRLKRKVTLMLLTIILLFIISWLPIQIAILYSEYRTDTHLPLPRWFDGFYDYASLVAFSNSAVNPIIYASFNENFRKVLSACRVFTPPRGGGGSGTKRIPPDHCRHAIALGKMSPYRHACDTQNQRCSKRTLLDADSDDTVTGVIQTHHQQQQQKKLYRPTVNSLVLASQRSVIDICNN